MQLKVRGPGPFRVRLGFQVRLRVRVWIRVRAGDMGWDLKLGT